MLRTGTLIGGPSDANVTNLARRFNGRPEGSSGTDSRTGPMRSTPIPFTLVANAPVVIAAMNPNRAGLLIQNLDPVGNLFVGFGVLADAFSLRLPPGGFMLLDFICPTDAISFFSTVNCAGYLCEWAKSYEYKPGAGE